MLKNSDGSETRMLFDERLRVFYSLIASRQFENALRIAADIRDQLEPADKVVLAALALRQDLQKFLG